MAVKTLGLLKRGVINSLSGSIFNPATPIYAAKLSAEVEVQFRYTRTKLYFLRRPTITNRIQSRAPFSHRYLRMDYFIIGGGEGEGEFHVT